MATQIICDCCEKIIGTAEEDRNILHIYLVNGYSIDASRNNTIIDKIADLCDEDKEKLIEKMLAIVEEYAG